MASYREDLLKAAGIARIKLSESEVAGLVPEVEEALKVFEKIDSFGDEVPEPAPEARQMRADTVRKSHVDTFSNSKFVRNKKFIAPKLVD